MAVDVVIKIEGLTPLLRKLDAAAADKTIRSAMFGSLALLRLELKKYPPPPGAGDWQGFVSDKQRRWFFANLREGNIQIPYRRQMARGLGGAWAQRIEGYAGNMVGIVGNNKSYARWVQDEARQARIHQGRWQTVQQVARDSLGKIARLFQQAVDAALRG